MTRRQLGTIALGAAAMPQVVSKAESVYDPTLDPVDWTKQRHDAAPLRMTFKAADRKQAEAWQKTFRAKLVELLGGFPAASAAPVAEIVESRDFPGYKRQRFLFESRPGVRVAGYLLTPKSGKAPYATVVCVPGHGRGADDIVGIDEKGRDRSDKPGYQHDFAIQVAEQGMAAVAIEPMAFGCRRDPITMKKGQGTSACQPAAGAALLLGETMIGWRVYDVMRTIDWIGTRPDLDVRRVGCMGISGGGTCTLFSAALDTRIQAAMVSCYLNTFRDSIVSLSHCMDNYVPGILNWAEMYDVGGLVAPRALFSEAGLQDPIFPIAGSRASFAKVKRVFDIFDAADRTEQHIFEGKHEFNGSRGIPFLARQLKA